MINRIQLHELLVRLQPDINVRIQKDFEVLIEGRVKDIHDLLGYHHNPVENIHLNLLGTMIIVIE